MDISSNNCIAWFCRSNRPFQTFPVSNISLLWLGATKSAYCNTLTYHSILYPIRERTRAFKWDHPFVWYFRLSPAHAYLLQVRVECGILWKTSTLVFKIHDQLFHHTCILGIGQYQPNTRLSLRVILMPNCFSQPKGVVENPYHTRGSFRLIVRTNTCLLFIYPHRSPFPNPYIGS